MIPSTKTIESRLGNTIRKEHGPLGIKIYVNAIRESIKKADLSDDYNDTDNALDEINKILHGYGVEAVHDNQWGRYYLSIGLLYVNMGDTYNQTVCYDTRKDRWFVCSWGDIVEKESKRFDV